MSKNASVSVAEIMESYKRGEITLADATELMNTTQPAKGPGAPAKFAVARNKSGGIYVRHPKVEGYSTEKKKKYVATVNFAVGVAETMFADDDVLLEIATGIRELLKSEK